MSVQQLPNSPSSTRKRSRSKSSDNRDEPSKRKALSSTLDVPPLTKEEVELLTKYLKSPSNLKVSPSSSRTEAWIRDQVDGTNTYSSFDPPDLLVVESKDSECEKSDPDEFYSDDCDSHSSPATIQSLTPTELEEWKAEVKRAQDAGPNDPVADEPHRNERPPGGSAVEESSRRVVTQGHDGHPQSSTSISHSQHGSLATVQTWVLSIHPHEVVNTAGSAI
ncbi:hypothetical protein M231_05768 [Tremella mesenterica]|uniref:Uncharacterized protein n=1 Tax=Tremella mesenterica TaxID=5217 RepID=A0A4Q1BH67_TREME|nr:hypothetical protein M231_05768 [Tremella mesenterica]